MSYYDELKGASSEHFKNALLFSWLADDEHRPKLYSELRTKQPVLRIASRAKREEGKETVDKPVFLLTRHKDIEVALRDFSNAPYKGIGTGTFVLALDNSEGHEEKRRFLNDALKKQRAYINELSALACYHALIGPSKQPDFDLVKDIAEQAALRFVSAFFGIPDKDHFLLQESMRRVYDAMIVQMFARHFVTEPLLIEGGKLAMGKLGQRIGELIADADFTQLTTQLLEVIQIDPAAANDFFSEVVTHVVTVLTVDSGEGIAEIVQTKGSDFQNGLKTSAAMAFGMANFLDAALNVAIVRSKLDDFVVGNTTLPLEMRRKFLALIQDMVDKKEQPEDRLAPRRYMLNKDGVRFSPRIEEQLGDLRFRIPVIEAIAREPGTNTGNDLVVAVLGAIAGLMGNVIAGACITINQYFKMDDSKRENLVKLAGVPAKLNQVSIDAAIDNAKNLIPFVNEALRLQPPAAFIPRIATNQVTFAGSSVTIEKGDEVLIPIGAATRDLPTSTPPADEFHEGRPDADYSFIFGDPATTDRSHRCLGDHIAIPLIANIVRSVLALPGLARPMKGDQPARLTKKWGYICESFPLQFNRQKSLVQQPLNVVMRIKAPVGEHAEFLKKIITYGIPSIELLLAGSRIVHSARFVFLNNETELGLFTVYDGEFEAYIEHFGRVAGRLFDRIFEHIEVAPTLPVRENLTEFVDIIRRFDQPSAAGYFFSAYPTTDVKGVLSKGISP